MVKKNETSEIITSLHMLDLTKEYIWDEIVEELVLMFYILLCVEYANGIMLKWNYIISYKFLDWFERHSHCQPLHWPVAFPLRWQSAEQVDSEAQRANSSGEILSSEHSQPWNVWK